MFGYVIIACHSDLSARSIPLVRFRLFWCTLFATFHPTVSGRDDNIYLTGGMLVVRQIRNNGVRVLLLDGRHRVEASRQLHVKGDLGWIKRQI